MHCTGNSQTQISPGMDLTGPCIGSSGLETKRRVRARGQIRVSTAWRRAAALDIGELPTAAQWGALPLGVVSVGGEGQRGVGGCRGGTFQLVGWWFPESALCQISQGHWVR